MSRAGDGVLAQHRVTALAASSSARTWLSLAAPIRPPLLAEAAAASKSDGCRPAAATRGWSPRRRPGAPTGRLAVARGRRRRRPARRSCGKKITLPVAWRCRPGRRVYCDSAPRRSGPGGYSVDVAPSSWKSRFDRGGIGRLDEGVVVVVEPEQGRVEAERVTEPVRADVDADHPAPVVRRAAAREASSGSTVSSVAWLVIRKGAFSARRLSTPRSSNARPGTTRARRSRRLPYGRHLSYHS